MTASKKLRAVLFICGTALLGVQILDHVPPLRMFSPVSSAEARVGRPLTPVSAAGVARRTVRRCAAGVYYC
ncbi:hypothetical protein BMJ34_00595 [Sinorhizobium medicae]|uniref:Uncharacterized protein n=1 Tax=Sinorhizobium medicae TaxID=110321 RepID=A0ABX4TCF9_9HYPH|nr:hypothetical protein [Sinorhizobium medicae]PLT92989.1 hypothetical protein BMJ33_32680 [Sinorhizobium medicae]PLU08767.1 hypothetical protein BMJ34_00595 [Sinorhizobium medicae]PLU12054.1 hypothetical protein BMJ29_33100 [Sinorhizobium medicae]PLU14090.1 hypothetical protein BMJ30_23980 [Sinorhizobium medicae]PLU35395.1 hypothetical protein BMJ27_13560 [Sinorhizobium medicae]